MQNFINALGNYRLVELLSRVVSVNEPVGSLIVPEEVVLEMTKGKGREGTSQRDGH